MCSHVPVCMLYLHAHGVYMLYAGIHRVHVCAFVFVCDCGSAYTVCVHLHIRDVSV